MSPSPTESTARRRRGLAGLALLAAVSALAAVRGGREDVEPIAVRREDLVLTVEVEGELAAVRATEIGTPPVSEVEFKIALLAAEGKEVKKGEPVLGFDTETLERQLETKTAELAEATKKAEQKEIDLRLKLLALQEQGAQAGADLQKATLKAEVPAAVQQRVELLKAQLAARGRQRDLENLQAETRATRERGDAELASLRGERDRAAGRVQALRTAIEAMTVEAPQDGIVVYPTNWRGEKKVVGDSTWFGEKVLSIPDLSEMRADGFVVEADGGAVAPGQRVTLRLEARPDLDVHGRVKSIGRTVRLRSWRTPGKVYKVDVVFDRTDTSVMRPAMRFRGEVETGRVPGLLLLPRTAVFLRDGGPVVWRRGALGWKEAPVRLGRSNRRLVEVASGLAEGDLVSPVDLAAAAPDATAPVTP